jgi:Flp pilus assembly pilin Flp
VWHAWFVARALAAGLRRRDEGASMVEYGMLVAAIALAVVVGAIALGLTVFNWYDVASRTVVP